MTDNRLPEHYYHQVVKDTYAPANPSPTVIYSLKTIKPSAPQPPERFVETLRARGIKVRVQHFRWTSQNLDHPMLQFFKEEQHTTPTLARVSKYSRKRHLFPDLVWQNGGETRVSVRLPDGREASGVAVCSFEDRYNKRLGVYLATKRALAALKVEATARKSPAVAAS